MAVPTAALCDGLSPEMLHQIILYSKAEAPRAVPYATHSLSCMSRGPVVVYLRAAQCRTRVLLIP